MEGVFHPDFGPVASALEELVAEEGRGGGAIAVYHGGEEVVDVWTGSSDGDGTPWSRDTLVMSFSTTKGVTATALHMCADRGLIAYDEPVGSYWPEFAQNGKEQITVRQLMCHTAGLHSLRGVIEDPSQVLDWDRMVRALALMTPAYEPGTNSAYHGLTFGWLVGELVRRVSGLSVGAFVRSEIAGPLGLDGLYIGLPPSEETRMAGWVALEDTLAEVEAMSEDRAQAQAADAELIGDPVPEQALEALMGPGALQAEVPAANGCFTSRSLARMYAALAAGGSLDGVTLMSPATLAEATVVQHTIPDLVLMIPAMWRLGWHGVLTSEGFLPNAFGHNGFGGSGAWADPDTELAVAYVPNRLGIGMVGDDRFASLGGVAYKAARERA
ncbi:MAG: hypothetical protein JJLCMIEE_02094 [Acidimicrobiales bacterium]|nr:hypothetical protein [Acidimicrobiales bacterium]